MYAVDALRQLTDRLLGRAELARFTHQGETLRALLAVVKHADRWRGWKGRKCCGLELVSL
jgi:hypothetical protein